MLEGALSHHGDIARKVDLHEIAAAVECGIPHLDEALGGAQGTHLALEAKRLRPDADDTVGQHGIDALIRLVGGELRDYDLVCHGSPSPRAPGKKSPPMNRGDMRYLLDFGLNDSGDRLGVGLRGVRVLRLDHHANHRLRATRAQQHAARIA